MPLGVQYSGMWTLAQQLQAIGAGTWKGISLDSLYVWGNNGSGQTGDNTTVTKSSPVQVGALTTWSQVAGGSNSGFSAAVKTDGTIWTWGSNNQGSLGDNTVVYRSSPVQVGSLTTWSKIAAGGSHSIAIKTDGTMWAWGWNTVGQLGDGTAITKSSPVQIGALTTWSQIFSGQLLNHTAALKTDGTMWLWGHNNYGQLGDNTAGIFRSSPVQVGSLTTWSKISGGNNHSLAIKTDGTLWSWGKDDYGALGDNTVGYRSSPVQVGSLTTWSQISGGQTHSMAIKTDGTLWTWGFNQYGKLGDNTIIDRSSPIQVGALTTWSKVACAGTHSIALKTDGTLWTWGFNNSGRLGDGTGTFRSSPVQIGSSTTWSQIAGGDSTSMAISHTIS